MRHNIKLAFSLAALATILSATSSATTVTYSTSGTVNCNGAAGCTQIDGQTIQFGGLQIQYSGAAPFTVDPEPFIFATFGDLFTTCIGGGTACPSSTIPTGVTLVVTINESVPGPVTNASIPAAAIQGTFSGGNSQALVQWPTPNQILIVTPTTITGYSIASNPLSLMPPSSNNCGGNPVNCGDTTIQGRVSQLTLSRPEPATWGLLGSGLATLIALRRKRVKSRPSTSIAF